MGQSEEAEWNGIEYSRNIISKAVLHSSFTGIACYGSKYFYTHIRRPMRMHLRTLMARATTERQPRRQLTEVVASAP